MKKKIFTLLTAVMVLSMGITVFAASSPDENAGYSEAGKQAVGSIDMGSTQGTDAKGNPVVLTVSPVSDPNHIASDNTAQVSVESALQRGEIKLALKENQKPKADVLGVVEVKTPAETSYPVTVTLSVKGVKAGDTVLLLHYVASGWESVAPTEVGDGYVKGVFYSFSPVAVVRVEAADSAPGTDGNKDSDKDKEETTETTETTTTVIVKETDTTEIVEKYYDDEDNTEGEEAADGADNTGNKGAKSGGSAVTSPKTGQPVMMLQYIAAVCVAGIFLCAYQMKKNK